MSQERVMLLIDADNVSIGVMEQAIQLLHKQHGAVHVRRAYCTAESAVKHQAAFKRLGIKPMVNLAAGKNSTDIAMAVDAIDLVLAERPDVVVIASSDSDFAPLVQRLREKGCIVRGIGQQGKTGDETQSVYDDFTVLAHRVAPSLAPQRNAARTASVVAPRVSAQADGDADDGATDEPVTAEPPPPAAKRASRKRSTTKTAGAAAPAAKTSARARKTSRAKPAAAPAAAIEEVATAAAAQATSSAALSEPVRAPSTGRPASQADTLRAVLDCLPELQAGQKLALNTAVQRLRESKVLGRNRSSATLFKQLEDQLELLPAGKPSQVRLRQR